MYREPPGSADTHARDEKSGVQTLVCHQDGQTKVCTPGQTKVCTPDLHGRITPASVRRRCRRCRAPGNIRERLW